MGRFEGERIDSGSAIAGGLIDDERFAGLAGIERLSRSSIRWLVMTSSRSCPTTTPS